MVNKDRRLGAPIVQVDVDTVLSLLRPIEGWFSEAEATELMSVAARALSELPHDHSIVEIGSYQGRSTVALASVVRRVRPGQQVVAIDPHDGEISSAGRSNEFRPPTYESFCRNLERAGLSSDVRPVRQRSTEVAWQGPIGLLLVDGWHDYASVSGDFAHFDQWVGPGGYIAFHDYAPNFPDVIRFVDEVCGTGRYAFFSQVGDLFVVRRTLAGPEPERFG